MTKEPELADWERVLLLQSKWSGTLAGIKRQEQNWRTVLSRNITPTRERILVERFIDDLGKILRGENI